METENINNQLEDLYEILDVDFGSTTDDIIHQYNKKIKTFKNLLSSGKKLTNEQKYQIKLLKISKYVLTNDSLREKYNITKIIEDSDDSNSVEAATNNIDNNFEVMNDKNDIHQFKNINIPLRKDKHLNYEQIAGRQFERFDHEKFDLSKDRQLRGAKNN